MERIWDGLSSWSKIDQCGPPVKGHDGQLVQLPASHEKTGIGFFALLQNRIDNADIGGAGQFIQFIQ
jgi:hypothetical protein